MTYNRNQIFKVVTKCNTTLVVVAISVERCTQLVEESGRTVDVVCRIGNAARGTAEGLCE